MMMTDWVKIGRITDIPRLGARRVETALGPVAVFRTADDSLFALLDRCPHKDGPLSQGIVHGRSVTCPLHNWVIEFESGRARQPDDGCVRTFKVRCKEGDVEVLIAPAADGCDEAAE
jgi:nitrite reductase (NADH) small subunit